MLNKNTAISAALLFLLIFSPVLFAEDDDVLNFPRRNAIVKVVEQVRDSVVNISTEMPIVVSSPWDEIFPQDRNFRTRKATSLGSGVIVDEDGFIITNAHVVQRATKITITLSCQEEYEASLISVQRENDLALLKINPKNKLKPISLGYSDDLMIGETAIALGNPYGLSSTVTVGVISATERSIHIQEEVIFKDFLQTDAAINPGNSGGPLVNINGKLIGINVSIHSQAHGIGFAIPVNRVRSVLRELISPGKLAEVSIGFSLEEKKEGGLYVLDVEPKGPADVAGFKNGDLLLSIEGDKIDNYLDLAKHLIDKKPGEKVSIRIKRADVEMDKSLVLAVAPETVGQKLAREKLGISINRIPAFKAREQGLDYQAYLVVQNTTEDSPAGRIGIQKGDVITELAYVERGRFAWRPYNDIRPHDYTDIEKFLENASEGRVISITIIRDGSELQGRLIIK